MTAPGASEQGIQFPGFTGGVNYQVHASRLEPTELRIARNVILGARGEVKSRHGAREFSVFTDAVGYKQLRKWNTDQLSSGTATQAMFVVKNTDDLVLVYNDSSSLGELMIDSTGPDGDDERFTHISMNGLAYVSSVQGAHEVDPDTPSTTALTSWDPDSGDTTTEFPACPVLLVQYERVFAARLADGPEEANKYRLYFSEPLLPKTWDTTNYIDINPDDGQPIQALRAFADQIIIFKDKSIWGLAGTEFEGLNVKLYNIEQAIGTTAPETIVDIGALLMFFDPSSGIYLFDGSAFQNVGEPVYEYIRDRWDAANISHSIAWYDDGRYYLSYPTNSSSGYPAETLVFDTQLQAWTVWDRGFQGAAIMDDDDGQTVMVVCNAGSADSFDGVAWLDKETPEDLDGDIELRIATGWLAPTGSATKHRIRQLILDLIDSASDTEVKVYIDQTTSPVYLDNLADDKVTIDTSDGNDYGLAFRTHAFNGFRWRSISIDVRATTSGSEWALNSMRVVTTSLDRYRSEYIA